MSSSLSSSSSSSSSCSSSRNDNRSNNAQRQIIDQLVVYQDPEPHTGAFNMAVDEALLETAAFPTLRTYRWQRPAVSFGYFGSFADVSKHQIELDLVRRWTGGGVVPHGKDFTYSIILPKSHHLCAQSSIEIYSWVHDAIRCALALKGIEAELAGSVGHKVSEHCFANPVRADLMVRGQKIAGAAHRRSRLGLLHQGSIQWPSLPPSFVDDLAATFCGQFERRPLSQALLNRADAIARAKYGTEAWLTRR